MCAGGVHLSCTCTRGPARTVQDGLCVRSWAGIVCAAAEPHSDVSSCDTINDPGATCSWVVFLVTRVQPGSGSSWFGATVRWQLLRASSSGCGLCGQQVAWQAGDE